MMTMVVASGAHVQASTGSVVIWFSYAGTSDWLNLITDSTNKYTKPVISYEKNSVYIPTNKLAISA